MKHLPALLLVLAVGCGPSHGDLRAVRSEQSALKKQVDELANKLDKALKEIERLNGQPRDAVADKADAQQAIQVPADLVVRSIRVVNPSGGSSILIDADEDGAAVTVRHGEHAAMLMAMKDTAELNFMKVGPEKNDPKLRISSSDKGTAVVLRGGENQTMLITDEGAAKLMFVNGDGDDRTIESIDKEGLADIEEFIQIVGKRLIE